MTKENISLNFFRLDETRNYFLDETKHNDLMREKHKKVFSAFNFFEYFQDFFSTVSGCVSISAFGSIVGVSVGISSFALGIKICTLIAGIKK